VASIQGEGNEPLKVLHLYKMELWAKYAGAIGYDQPYHFDYGNHSLVVPKLDSSHIQMTCFILLSVGGGHGAHDTSGADPVRLSAAGRRLLGNADDPGTVPSPIARARPARSPQARVIGSADPWRRAARRADRAFEGFGRGDCRHGGRALPRSLDPAYGLPRDSATSRRRALAYASISIASRTPA